MSGVLALVGGGEWTDGCTFDPELLEASGGDTVLVVPTAAAYENHAKHVAAARAWFESLGASIGVLEVYTRRDALDDASIAAVASASFVYFCDGSSMHLRSVLKDTALWDAIVQRWREGMVLAGAGAGAVVMCDHMVDPRGGAFTVGLGLATRLSVIPRYNLWSPEKSHRTVKLAPPGLVVAGVPEHTALLRDVHGAWHGAGTGPVEVFLHGEKVDLDALPGETE